MIYALAVPNKILETVPVEYRHEFMAVLEDKYNSLYIPASAWAEADSYAAAYAYLRDQGLVWKEVVVNGTIVGMWVKP